MTLSYALSYFAGSWLLVFFIIYDYVQRFNTVRYQKRIFLRILACFLCAITLDLLYFIFFEKAAEPGPLWLFYLINSLYYIFQIFLFYDLIIFIDYQAYKDPARLKKLEIAALVIMSLFAVSLFFNIGGNFYFYLSADARYMHGSLYIIIMAASFLPAVLIITDMIVSFKAFRYYQAALFLFTLIIVSAGVMADNLFGTRLIWPMLSGALLFAYFFVVKTDSSIDSLTGIGNRHAFNEFIERLARQSMKESWAFVMIDLDHFKEINDTLGHAEGDNALRDFAAIITGQIRRTDFAARYGGDEFIIAASSSDNVPLLMERIEAALQTQNEKQLRPYKLEMSYGYDIFTAGYKRSISEFINRIDNLMYQNKSAKRFRAVGGPG